MNGKTEVIVYVSNDCTVCTTVISKIESWNVSYDIRNISKSEKYLKEMQARGSYSTPATYIKGQARGILGYDVLLLRSGLQAIQSNKLNWDMLWREQDSSLSSQNENTHIK